MALLYDKLKHPDGDLGMDSPSCLTWNYDPLKEIDHICIGKAAGPGGAWNDLDGSQLTISPSRWMELPDMSYSDWERQSKCSNMNAGLVFSSKNSNFSEDNSLLNAYSITNKPYNFKTYLKQISTEESRPSMHDVRNYYRDYVKQKNLDKYLLNNATVTSVRPIKCSKLVCSSSGHNQIVCPSSGHNQTLWEVTGLIDKRDRKKASSLTHKGDLMEFRFVCKHVVLACGANDLHNDLHVKGENSRFVLRSIRELEDKIRDDLQRLQKDPLLVVGSGLSAADAILLAQKYRIKIVHVIRRSVNDSNLIFSKLPKKTYPEYQRVYEKMLKNRYTNLNSATSSNDLATSQEEKLRRPLSHNDLNNIPTTLINESNEKNENCKTNYILYDEHQIKCFTSKRTCILVKSNFTNSKHCTANKQLQKQHHQINQRLLNEFDEEAECATESNENQNCLYRKPCLSNEETELKISYACILIGYSPDLDFMPPLILNDMAVNPEKMLNTKENPILIDLYTHESVKFKTLYAMGPLIGDNFVRFGTGGALAITARIVDYLKKERRNSNASKTSALIDSSIKQIENKISILNS